MVTPTRSEQIAVIAVNWRRADLTLTCLAALRCTLGTAWHLYLVDNASGDDSVERLSNLGDDVTLIVSDHNAGWSGGNNIGVTAALAAGHAHIFLLNNDASVRPDTIARLLNAFEASLPDYPILGPVHQAPDNAEYTFMGADIDAKTGMPYNLQCDDFNSTTVRPLIETAYIKGAGIFAHRRHFNKIGLFDDCFYLNYDETDWCFRAREAGFTNYLVRDAIIEHEGSATIGGESSPLNIYFLVRNSLLFAERHLSIRQRLSVFMNTFSQARNLYPGAGRLWLWRFLIEDMGGYAAFRMGVRDYILRRFGDCPRKIRAMAGLT